MEQITGYRIVAALDQIGLTAATATEAVTQLADTLGVGTDDAVIFFLRSIQYVPRTGVPGMGRFGELTNFLTTGEYSTPATSSPLPGDISVPFAGLQRLREMAGLLPDNALSVADRKQITDPAAALWIPQHQFAIAVPSASIQYLKTSSVATCYVLTLYDPTTHTGVLAHIDNFTDVADSLRQISAQLRDRQIHIQQMTATLVGGYRNLTEADAERIVEATGAVGLTISAWDILSDGPPLTSAADLGEQILAGQRRIVNLALNLQDGTLAEYHPTRPLPPTPWKALLHQAREHFNATQQPTPLFVATTQPNQ